GRQEAGSAEQTIQPAGPYQGPMTGIVANDKERSNDPGLGDQGSQPLPPGRQQEHAEKGQNVKGGTKSVNCPAAQVGAGEGATGEGGRPGGGRVGGGGARPGGRSRLHEVLRLVFARPLSLLPVGPSSRCGGKFPTCRGRPASWKLAATKGRSRVGDG